MQRARAARRLASLLEDAGGRARERTGICHARSVARELKPRATRSGDGVQVDGGDGVSRKRRVSGEARGPDPSERAAVRRQKDERSRRTDPL